MKILLVGGKGLLGSNIAPLLAEKYDLAVCDIDTWDITDHGAGREQMEKYGPDVVVNLAAVTDVDGCEDEKKELAERVNGYGPGILASLCKERKILFVHFSTDYVFDGKKNPSLQRR